MWKRISSLALLCASGAIGERIESARPVMGTLARITVEADDQARASRAMEQAFERMRALDAKLSDYDPESELNRMPARRSRDLQQVLRQAEKIRRDSGGAFDHTAGAVTRLWRKVRGEGRLPSTAEIAAARRAAVRMDLGGIAKGYAAEEALVVLRARGFGRAMVAIAGDLCVGDPPPGRDAWSIEVEPGRARRRLRIRNACVSTSGDAEQSLVVNGIRYSHIIDPRTGEALTKPIGVTVVAKRGMTADALATALSVLGANDGLLRRYHAAAIVWTPDSTLESQLHLFERTGPIGAEQAR